MKGYDQGEEVVSARNKSQRVEAKIFHGEFRMGLACCDGQRRANKGPRNERRENKRSKRVLRLVWLVSSLLSIYGQSVCACVCLDKGTNKALRRCKQTKIKPKPTIQIPKNPSPSTSRPVHSSHKTLLHRNIGNSDASPNYRRASTAIASW
jgi:hypothetical protein